MLKGLILAGGKSRRFGEDKALIKLNGQTLVERMVTLLNKLSMEPAVVTASKREYSFLDCSVIHDIYPDKGPLGGIYTGFEILKSSLLVLTCDMPALEEDLLLRLVQASQGSDALATLYKANEKGWEPFPGIYDIALFPLVKTQLDAEKLSMQKLLDETPKIEEISFEEEKQQAFRNINTQEDWQAFEV